MRRTALLTGFALGLAGCADRPLTTAVPHDVHLSAASTNTIVVTSLDDPGDGVCTPAHCTLREAIAAAQAGDRIEFAPGLEGSVELSGEQLTITRNLTIDGDGRITLDGRWESRVVQTDSEVMLQGLRITRGATFSVAGFAVGGGIYNTGNLTLTDVVVSDSRSNGGAGIYTAGNSTLVLVDSRVHSNWAHSNIDGDAYGGGIYTAGTTELLRSLVSDNSSEQHSGGIHNLGIAAITQSTISGNEASQNGGGIYNTGTLTITRSTISGNEAEANGGGIYSDRTLAVVLSTVSGNKVPTTNSLGGGIYAEGSVATIRSSTIVGNSGGGVYTAMQGSFAGIPGGSATVANSIIAGNGLDCRRGDISTVPLRSLGHNLYSISLCPTDGTGDVLVDPAQVFSAVVEQALADNGGPTKTHALIERGLAVDAGYCPGETADQRGLARPVDVTGITNARDGCDIGAFEWQPGAQAPPKRADLMVSVGVNKTSVKQGDQLTYLVRVQNLGPESAPNVVVNNLLSTGVTFVAIRANRGTHTAPPPGETGTVTWYLGELENAGNEVAELEVTVIARGKTTITHTSTVTGDVDDPNAANNTAAISVSVGAGGGGAGGGGGKKN